VLAWGMYDLANQSFTLLVNTLLFAVYFKEVVVGPGNPARGDRLWALLVASSMLVVVAVSPLLGAMADCRGRRKAFLIGSGVACVVLTAGLALVQPGQILLAALLYIPANIAYQLGENFLASFLPVVSSRRNIGRVSAIGWTMGYVGALLLLLIAYAAIGPLGLSAPQQWRPLFILTAGWFLIGMIAPMLALPEPPPAPAPGGSILAAGFGRPARTIRDAGRFRQLGVFLVAFFVYGMGVQATIFFASIITRGFGFSTVRLVEFYLTMTLVAAVSAILTSRFQDRIGTRTTVIVYLVIWILSAGTLAVLSWTALPAQRVFWFVALGLGFGLGGIGTASRAMVGLFTPHHRTAEFFGLWGMAYKSSAVVGVAGFGLTKAAAGAGPALGVLTGFFVVGLALVLCVNPRAGIRVAQRAERDEAKASGRGVAPPNRCSPTVPHA